MQPLLTRPWLSSKGKRPRRAANIDNNNYNLNGSGRGSAQFEAGVERAIRLFKAVRRRMMRSNPPSAPCAINKSLLIIKHPFLSVVNLITPEL